MTSIKSLRDKASGGRMAKLRSLHAGKVGKADDDCRAFGGSAKANKLDDVNAVDGAPAKPPPGKAARMKGSKAGSKSVKDNKGKSSTVNIIIATGGGKGPPGGDPLAGMGGPPPGPPPGGPPPGPMAAGPPMGGPGPMGGPPLPPKPAGPPMMRKHGGRVKMPKMAGANRAKP